MKIVVRYGASQLELGIDAGDDRVVGFWPGQDRTVTLDPAAFAEAVRAPREFPPLALAVVPGDRVAVALGLAGPAALAAVAELSRVFASADLAEFVVVSTNPQPGEMPPGVTWEVHNPDDRTRIAYLATTKDGQRVYLNRSLTDADFVLPVGWLGFDRALGYSGPWSALYPGLSDRETLTRFRAMVAPPRAAGTDALPPGLAESSEVGWLIGCQLQVGVLPGSEGRPASVIAGLEALVRREGVAAVDRNSTFCVADRADVVIVGVRGQGPLATIDELGGALEAATRLVRRGGKIVALSDLDGPFGPATRRLAGVENPKAALTRLRGHEADLDHLAATQIATSLAWADVYLHSRLDPDAVEDLAIIPLGRAEEARKLAGSAASLIAVNDAERTLCRVADEA